MTVDYIHLLTYHIKSTIFNDCYKIQKDSLIGYVRSPGQQHETQNVGYKNCFHHSGFWNLETATGSHAILK